MKHHEKSLSTHPRKRSVWRRILRVIGVLALLGVLVYGGLAFYDSVSGLLGADPGGRVVGAVRVAYAHHLTGVRGGGHRSPFVMIWNQIGRE